jgi:hypothetical protein
MIVCQSTKASENQLFFHISQPLHLFFTQCILASAEVLVESVRKESYNSLTSVQDVEKSEGKV